MVSQTYQEQETNVYIGFHYCVGTAVNTKCLDKVVGETIIGVLT